MDLLEKYTRMCGEAEEVQKEWKPQVGDYVVFARSDIGIIVGKEKERISNTITVYSYRIYSFALPEDYCRFYWQDRHQLTWLPRQDQLQEMIEWGGVCRDSIQMDLFDFAGLLFDTDDYMSWEEFWLRAVMWEKHNKVWNEQEEKWVKEEQND